MRRKGRSIGHLYRFQWIDDGLVTLTKEGASSLSQSESFELEWPGNFSNSDILIGLQVPKHPGKQANSTWPIVWQ